MENFTYPIRLNRYLFLKGYCSRRQGDIFIKEGHIKVNDKIAITGQILQAKDTVEVGDKIKNLKETFEYYIFNKPINVVSHNPKANEKSIENVFKTKEEIFPVGRLDKDSEGLMFMTNDRRIINKILNPKFEHEKEYLVYLDKEIKNSFKKKMESGVNIEGYITKPSKVSILSEKNFKITLTEGKTHQIRRMCASLGYQVKKLKRIRMMNLKLGDLTVGQGRKLTLEERGELLGSIGMVG